MYETHFGLKKRPFRALALGNDVFIGPQTAAAMAAIKKALATPDAIAAVTGPVGGGKTTVVGRAIDGLGRKCVTVPVGRIKLGTDEVLELLLGELGVDDMPPSTVQRFTVFRRLLKKFADDETQVVVVVEDAVRVGVDSLSELEALTAADAGVSDGANIVLMGDENLKALLNTPALARIKQRLRVRQDLPPLAANELHAYFKHCFRLAGGEFDSLFGLGAAPLIHELSGGIPRMANNLIESALAATAEAGLKQVSESQIRTVASSEYGLDVADSGSPEAAPATQVPEPAPESEPMIEPGPPEPPAPAAESAATEEEDDIPELIQDTLPDLEVLAPQLTVAAKESVAPAAADEKEADATPDSPEEDKAPAIPGRPAALLPDAAPPPQASADVPDWEREPTLAELRPDLDALEQAMAVAQGRDKDDDEEDLPVIQPEPAVARPPEVVPEITLDREIQAKIEEAAEAIKRTEEEAAAKAAADAEAAKSIDIAATGEMQVELPPLRAPAPEPTGAGAPPPKPKDATEEPAAEQDSENSAELKRIASNLSRARTIDDVDDKMAETLFGEEFSEIAAQVAAKASQLPANDELELVEEEAAAKPLAAGGGAAVNVAPASLSSASPPPLDEAASRRLATVRALNGTQNVPPPMPSSAESIVMSHEPVSVRSPSAGDQPDSIEDQINTSMTATLQALEEQPRHDDDDDDEGKKGFFGLFRRS